MKKSVHIHKIEELFPATGTAAGIRGKITCIEIGNEEVIRKLQAPVFLNAAIALFVLSGTATININYRRYPIRINSAIVLSASHLFNLDDCSKDFKCLCLLVSKEFMIEMDVTDMIYRRIKYGVKLYNTPVMQLTAENIALLSERVSAINRTIDNTEHLYQQDLVLNQLFTFYLDLSNIIDRLNDYQDTGSLTRYESIIKSFIELLVDNYRKEHKVEFYASQLNISAHYLTLTVKRITGQTVSDFIFEMLYSEARNLLTHSRLSIQEITTLLNFSDQSAFGKFFKRKAGISPADFRKK